MGIQETAQDVKHLVQALAEGKTVEYRARNPRGFWHDYSPCEGELGFTTHLYEYRIKRDLREELFELVRKYGREMYYAGQANGQDLAGAEASRRESAKTDGEKIEEIVNGLFGVTK
jgi:hypothetical protein